MLRTGPNVALTAICFYGDGSSGVLLAFLARKKMKNFVLQRFKYQIFLLLFSLKLTSLVLFLCSRFGGKILPFVFPSHKCHIPPNLWPYSAFTLLGVGFHGNSSAFQRVTPTQVSNPHWGVGSVFFIRSTLSILLPFLSFSVGRIKETFSVWRGAWHFLCDLPGTQQTTRLLRRLSVCVCVFSPALAGRSVRILLTALSVCLFLFALFKRDWMRSI